MKGTQSATVNEKFNHVRSSGYLTPKYRYRKPPSTMSWLEMDDMDLDDINGKDQSKSPEPQLDDFIQKVLQDKRVPITRRKENAYKSALYLANSIVGAAFESEWLYPMFLEHTDRKPVICDFRAVDKNVYVALVSLRMPSRLDTFTVAYTSQGDLPTHRMLVHVNKKITKEERLNIQDEWGPCLDSKGFLRPDFILGWFNKGLIKACENIEVENKRTQKLAFLETSLADDGTVWVHIIGFDLQENYKINIVPCLPLTEVPKQLCIIAPIPSRRPYTCDHHKFLQDVHERITSGDQILILEARLERWSRSLKCNPTIEISWGVHIGQLEDRAFAFLNSLSPAKLFENMIVLINAIKEEHAFCLHAVSNKVINHAIFFQYRRDLGKLTKIQDWFLAVLETIELQLGLQVFPNFFLPKQNILKESDPEVLKLNKSELKRLINCLKNNPEYLCAYSGCDDTSKGDDGEKDKSDEENDQENSDEKNGVHFAD